MPLISFSKSRSQKSNKSPVLSSLSTPQTAHAAPSTSSIHLNAPSTASLSSSHIGSRSLRRNKDRFSKAFNFSLESFKVVGSIRGRSKPIPDLNNNISSQSIPQSYTTYAGYEDDEYGEPEAEAEEIRPPSGLGRTASILEFKNDVIDKSSRTSASAFRSPNQSRISESSDDDSDSLVEIRYPSGLGNIKLTITPVSVIKPKELARSTYPDLYLQYSRTNSSLRNRRNYVKETTYPPSPHSLPYSVPVLLPRDYSNNLCKLLPVLNSYFDTTTLSTLTLVNRSVGMEARKLLWRHVRIPLRLILSKSGNKALLDGDRAAAFLDFLARKDVSHFVNSLELVCHIELEPSCIEVSPNRDNTLPSHPRSRPPPLSLLLNNHNLSPLKFTATASPLTPSLITARTYDTTISSTPSRFRRASIIIRNSTIPSAFRNSSLGRRLSMLKTPTRGSLPDDDGSKSMSNIGQASFSATQSQSRHLTSLSISSSSTWQPPREWERLDCGSTSPSPSIVPVSAQRSGSPSSFRTPTPNSGWNPPASWNNSPSNANHPAPSSAEASTSSRTARHAPSLANLKSKKRNPRLSLSLLPTQSTPSLASRSSPLAVTPTSPDFSCGSPQISSSVQPPPSSFRFEYPSQGTPPAPLTPVTPHSAISLSAFPLPPPITPSRSPNSAPYSHPSPIVTISMSIPNHVASSFQPYSTAPYPSMTAGFDSQALPESESENLPIQYLHEPDDLINDFSSVSFKFLESGGDEVIITSGQPGFIDGLKIGLKELTNLKAVTTRYDVIPSASRSSVERPNFRFNLLRAANQLFVTSLKDLPGLKSIMIACPTGYSQLCSTQLAELGKLFTNVETSVVACDILHH